MDKMKGLTRWLKRYHFWVLVVALFLVGFAVFFLVRGSLAGQSDSNKSTIEQKFSSMRSLANFPHHPNREYEERMDEQIRLTRDSVRKAWEVKYDKQADLFPWPEELREDFRNAVKDLRPIEATVPFPTEEEPLSINLRNYYRLYIRDEVKKLAEKIGAAEVKPVVSGTPFGGGQEAAPAPKKNAKGVVWLNQQETQKNHFDWSDQRPSVPSTLQVLYAHEDARVLDALMEIILETNGGKDPSVELPITTIEYIRIGKSAQKLEGKVTAGTGDTARGGGHGQPAPEEGFEEPYEEPVFEGEGEGAYEEGTGDDPADGRYVDMENNKLSGQQLRGTTSGDAGAQQGSLAVAKRIPVQMRLVIDQRKISKLLVACGNSPLTVEVQQMRVNPAGGPRRRGEKDGMAAAPQQSGAAHQNYVPVELYGIVSVYNPVDYTALGVEEEEPEEGAEEAAGDGTQPADETGESTAPADAAGETPDTGETGADAAAGDAAEGTEPAGAGPADADAAAGTPPATDEAAEPATP